MMKMLIKLDEDKIRREKKYDINKINAYLTSAFEKSGMTQNEDDWYINGNFTTCGSMTIILSDKDWFMDNVTDWLLVDKSDSSTDDLKAFYSKKRLAVG